MIGRWRGSFFFILLVTVPFFVSFCHIEPVNATPSGNHYGDLKSLTGTVDLNWTFLGTKGRAGKMEVTISTPYYWHKGCIENATVTMKLTVFAAGYGCSIGHLSVESKNGLFSSTEYPTANLTVGRSITYTLSDYIENATFTEDSVYIEFTWGTSPATFTSGTVNTQNSISASVKVVDVSVNASVSSSTVSRGDKLRIDVSLKNWHSKRIEIYATTSKPSLYLSSSDLIYNGTATDSSLSYEWRVPDNQPLGKTYIVVKTDGWSRYTDVEVKENVVTANLALIFLLACTFIVGLPAFSTYKKEGLTGVTSYSLPDAIASMGGILGVISPFLAWVTISFTLLGLTVTIPVTGFGEFSVLGYTVRIDALNQFGWLALLGGIVGIIAGLFPKKQFKSVLSIYSCLLMVSAQLGWYIVGVRSAAQSYSSVAPLTELNIGIGIGLILLGLAILLQLIHVIALKFPEKVPATLTKPLKPLAPPPSPTPPTIPPSEPTVPAKKFCIACGTEIPAYAKHCPKCGAKQE